MDPTPFLNAAAQQASAPIVAHTRVLLGAQLLFIDGVLCAAPGRLVFVEDEFGQPGDCTVFELAQWALRTESDLLGSRLQLLRGEERVLFSQIETTELEALLAAAGASGVEDASTATGADEPSSEFRTAFDQAASAPAPELAGIDDQVRLRAQAEQHLAAGQPLQALHCLQRVLELATAPAEVCAAQHALGELYRDHLGAPVEAVAAFREALEIDPTRVASFEALERILTEHRQWRRLEEHYRDLLAMVPRDQEELRLLLWRNLAELYAGTLKDLDAAIAAYEVVTRLDPTAEADLETLAALYAYSPAHRDQARAASHAALASANNPVGPLRRLRALYQRQRQYDAVHSVCAALVASGWANDNERRMQAHLERGLPARASHPLRPEDWQRLLLPELDAPLGRLLTALAGQSAVLFADWQPDLGAVAALDLAKRPLPPLAERFVYLREFLGIKAAPLLVARGQALPLSLTPSLQHACVIGEKHPLLLSTGPEATYLAAYEMAFARPELLLVRLLPERDLANLLVGVLRATSEQAAPVERVDAAVVERWRGVAVKRKLRDVLGLSRQELAAAQAQLLDAGAFARQRAVVDLSAHRVALIAANSLAQAFAGVQALPPDQLLVDRRRLLRDLTLFSVSPDCLAVRQGLGLAVRAS